MLVAVFPGVFVAAGQERVAEVRIRAAALFGRGVITGRAAARLTFWPGLPLSGIRIATHVDRRRYGEVSFERRDIPPEWRWQRGGITVTKPALTAVDLIPDLGGAVISEAMCAARLTGWVANLRCTINGHLRYLDIVFPEHGVVIEVDGYASHQFERRAQFELDRFTMAWLAARGWRVLRFTWRQIIESPEWVIDTIRRTLRLAEADRSSTQRARMAAIGR